MVWKLSILNLCQSLHKSNTLNGMIDSNQNQIECKHFFIPHLFLQFLRIFLFILYFLSKIERDKKNEIKCLQENLRENNTRNQKLYEQAEGKSALFDDSRPKGKM